MTKVWANTWYETCSHSVMEYGTTNHRLMPNSLQNHSASGTFRTTPFSEGFTGYRYSSYSPHFRRSMPNVNLHQHTNEPPRQYPYHLLITNNYRLPPGMQVRQKLEAPITHLFLADVDRCHLERHLQNSEFEYILGVSRMDFYRLPEWRRNELKKRSKLFWDVRPEPSSRSLPFQRNSPLCSLARLYRLFFIILTADYRPKGRSYFNLPILWSGQSFDIINVVSYSNFFFLLLNSSFSSQFNKLSFVF